MEIRTVLVATDFSDDAELAVKAAAALAKRFGARIHVHHALEVPLPVFQPYQIAVPEVFIGEVRKAAREKLDALHAGFVAEGLEAEVTLGAVPAAASVADRAREVRADLVVVGSRGHTGLPHLVLGSVAEGAVRAVRCSVLTVKGEGDVIAPRTIVVACDFSEPAEFARREACALAGRFDADLHLVHGLSSPHPIVSPYEVPVPADYTIAIEREAERRIGELAAKCQIQGKVTTAVISGTPHAVITAEAARVGADCIVTGSRGLTGLKHLILGSVAQRTLRTAPCSVWTVHPPREDAAA